MKTSPSKILLRGLLAAAICLPSLAASAVTDEEMDHARAIAGQVYLRYTNDKAEYLDGKKAQSVKELRSMVEGHKTDADNLKQFLAAPVSKDYASWGKEQLAAYWSKTFFQNANLSKKAEQSRNNTIKARISTMTVTEPAAEKPQPEEQQQEQQTAPAEQTAAQEVPVQAVDSAAEETSADEEIAQADQGSNTWLYVVLLIVLIGIVIWLVLYAMRAMKDPEQKQASPEKRKKAAAPAEQEEKYAPQPAPTYDATDTPDTGIEEMQARYANTVAAKNDEIERLRRALDNSRAAEQEARSRADQLADRISQLQQQLQSMRDKPAPQPVQPRPKPAPGGERIIYLGRANRNRVFVRADRQVTPGKTVYRLVTTNNLTGTFTVETDPSVVALVSLDAQTALYGACEAPTLAGAESCSRIVTDTAGSAIFEDNCWKVLHPAAVHLE